jgi:hypothetical protein
MSPNRRMILGLSLLTGMSWLLLGLTGASTPRSSRAGAGCPQLVVVMLVDGLSPRSSSRAVSASARAASPG